MPPEMTVRPSTTRILEWFQEKAVREAVIEAMLRLTEEAAGPSLATSSSR